MTHESDITDEAFIVAILHCCAEREMSFATRWDVAAVLAGHPEDVEGTPRDYPDMPKEMVLAKAADLARRGLISACTCGCRGDFEVTPTAAYSIEAWRAEVERRLSGMLPDGFEARFDDTLLRRSPEEPTP